MNGMTQLRRLGVVAITSYPLPTNASKFTVSSAPSSRKRSKSSRLQLKTIDSSTKFRPKRTSCLNRHSIGSKKDSISCISVGINSKIRLHQATPASNNFSNLSSKCSKLTAKSENGRPRRSSNSPSKAMKVPLWAYFHITNRKFQVGVPLNSSTKVALVT